MKRDSIVLVVVVAGGLLMGGAVRVSAQAAPLPPPPPPEPMTAGVAVQAFSFDIDGMEEAGPMMSPEEVELEVAAAPVGVGGEIVKGAPYSAEAVTEMVRTLGDGNRIVHQGTASVYRDGAGRTRREQGMAVVGALVGNTEGPRHVVITDPAAGASYILDPEAKTAHKLTPPRFKWLGAPPAGPDGTFTEPLPPPPPSGSAPPPRVAYRARMRGNRTPPVVEPLGKQIIEGVEVEGTRSTMTIPAGQIGNEQPIRVVSERWYSPELRVLVQSKRSDPRYGDSSYRLTNIVRAEPSPSLFEVPSDYSVSEGRKDMLYRRHIQK